MFSKKRSVPTKKAVKPTNTPTKSKGTPSKVTIRPTKTNDNPTDSGDDSKPEEDPDTQWTTPFEASDDVATADIGPSHPSEFSVDTHDQTPDKNPDSQNFLALKDNRHRAINIKFSDDKHTPQITSCCFMPSGDLVACDYKNQVIKSFSDVFSNKGNLSLPGPFGIAVLDKQNAIVTIPGQKQLQLIQVLPNIQKASIIEVKKECWGVAVSGDKIFVTCYTSGNDDFEVRLYGLIGNLVNSLRVYQVGSHIQRRLDNIGVSRSGDKIYLPDWETDIVSCLTAAGELIYQYQDAELVSPRGLYVDDRDNVVICGHEGRCVHVITADGRKQTVLLSNTFYDPCSVAVRPSDGTLVVGCSRSEEIFYYKLS